NGTTGVVVAVDPEKGELALRSSDGAVFQLPADYVVRHTDYAYAWTLHKGQGQTVGQAARTEMDGERRRGRAFVYGAEGLSAEAALVAASRAVDSTELFVLAEDDERQ